MSHPWESKWFPWNSTDSEWQGCFIAFKWVGIKDNAYWPASEHFMSSERLINLWSSICRANSCVLVRIKSFLLFPDWGWVTIIVKLPQIRFKRILKWPSGLFFFFSFWYVRVCVDHKINHSYFRGLLWWKSHRKWPWGSSVPTVFTPTRQHKERDWRLGAEQREALCRWETKYLTNELGDAKHRATRRIKIGFLR